MADLKTLMGGLLNFLLPKSPEETRLQKITAEDLYSRIARPGEQEGVRTLFDYRDPLIRELLLSLKFHGNRRAAKIFAQVFYEGLIEDLSDANLFSDFSKPLLVPIPLSKKRLRERGYNQTELIAQELEALDGRKTFELVTDVLIKIKHIAPQTSLPDKKAREENIRGAFAVHRTPQIAGRNILLLDDIVTTGSTMREAEGALRAAGAKHVFCIAIAH